MLPASPISLPASFNPTERDFETLYYIYLRNTCSIRQIAERFYGGSLSYCYRRLGQMRETAVGLISWNRPGSSSGVGSGQALLSLTKKGRVLLATEYLHVPPTTIRPLKQISSSYGRDHHLSIVDFCVAVDLAIGERAGGEAYPSHEWESERELNLRPIRVTKSRRPSPKLPYFIPDQGLIIRLSPHPDQQQCFKLEMEMNPLKRPRVIKDKIAGYMDYIYFLSKENPDTKEVPFILWVVPEAKAQAALIGWILELSAAFGDDPSYFWVTTRSHVTTERILTPIWQVAGVERPQSLIPTAVAVATEAPQPLLPAYAEPTQQPYL